MDAKKLRDWVAQQIELNAPGPDVGKATRLLESAMVLRDGMWSHQLFGISLPREGVVDARALYERCIQLVRECLPVLNDASRAQVTEVLGRVEGATRRVPAATHHLVLFTNATLYDPETDEEPHEPAQLKLFDGATDAHGLELGDIPCIDEALGGTNQLGRSTPWARGLNAHLVFDEATQTLRCALPFDIVTMPDASALAELRRVVEDELFFTGWGLNLEWETDSDIGSLCPQVQTKIVAETLDEAA